MRRRFVDPWVPNGMPAMISSGRPGSAEPSLVAMAVTFATMSSTLVASSVWTVSDLLTAPLTAVPDSLRSGIQFKRWA